MEHIIQFNCCEIINTVAVL